MHTRDEQFKFLITFYQKYRGKKIDGITSLKCLKKNITWNSISSETWLYKWKCCDYTVFHCILHCIPQHLKINQKKAKKYLLPPDQHWKKCWSPSATGEMTACGNLDGWKGTKITKKSKYGDEYKMLKPHPHHLISLKDTWLFNINNTEIVPLYCVFNISRCKMYDKNMKDTGWQMAYIVLSFYVK